MRTSWSAIGGLLLSCCQPSPSPEPAKAAPVFVAEPEPRATAAPLAPDPAPAPARDASSASVAVGDWGIGIEVPSNAQSFHEAEANRHSIAISQLVSVTLWRIPLAMPETIAEAKVSGPDGAIFDQGTTDGGVLYAVQSLRVRDGFRAGTGTHVHFYRTVGRVFALLPLDASSHVRCTGYVERSVESAGDADLDTVRKICLSMRRR